MVRLIEGRPQEETVYQVQVHSLNPVKRVRSFDESRFLAAKGLAKGETQEAWLYFDVTPCDYDDKPVLIARDELMYPPRRSVTLDDWIGRIEDLTEDLDRGQLEEGFVQEFPYQATYEKFLIAQISVQLLDRAFSSLIYPPLISGKADRSNAIIYMAALAWPELKTEAHAQRPLNAKPATVHSFEQARRRASGQS